MSTITSASMIASPPPVGVERDVRTMLLQAGVGQYNASMLTTQMFLMPRTTDPSAQATMLIVQGVQRLLGLPATGQADMRTKAALRQFSGPTWTNKTWVQIYGDLLDMSPRQRASVLRGAGFSSTADYIEVGDTATTVSIGALALGVGLLLLATR